MLAACIGAQGAATASAAAPDCAGRGVPDSKISIQLWTFAEYIGFGTDAATIERTREVFEFLSETGYRNVEPFTLSGLSAEDYKALLDEYGLKASARHVGIGTPEDPADFDQIIEENRTLGIKYFGSGSTPIFPEVYTTKEEWLAYAAYLDELGEAARKAGQQLMVHNHHIEFLRSFDGQTVYDLLAENTDPRNVVFQLDLYWATNAGVDPLERDRAVRQPDPALPRQGRGRERRHRDRRRGHDRLPVDLRGRRRQHPVLRRRARPALRRSRRSTRSRPPRRASPTSTASPTDAFLHIPKEDTRAKSTLARGPGRGPCGMRHPVRGVGPVGAARLAVPEGPDRPDAG